MSPNARKLMCEMSKAVRLIAELPDDERLRLGAIEGETDALECMDAYAEAAIADAALVKTARARAKRLEARAERSREVVTAILEELKLKSAQRALFTATLSRGDELEEVPTNEELPTTFMRFAPDKILIKKTLRSGHPVPGYELKLKAKVTLTLRTDAGSDEETDE